MWTRARLHLGDDGPSRHLSRGHGFAPPASRRGPLLSDARTTAFRLLNGAPDGVPDVTVDTFAGVHVVSLYRDFTPPRRRPCSTRRVEAWAPRSLYLKRRPREARVLANAAKDVLAPERPPEASPWSPWRRWRTACASSSAPAQGLSVGLYLDMRDTRAWLLGQVRGLTVLNLFSYTCAFGVVATAGGATRVLNIDTSRRVLDWGEENARLNGQPVDRYDYVAGDVFDWLGRLAKKGQAFDVVISDPPVLLHHPHQPASPPRKDYARLAEAAARVVAPGGPAGGLLQPRPACTPAPLRGHGGRGGRARGPAGAARCARSVPLRSISRPRPRSPPGLKVNVIQLR